MINNAIGYVESLPRGQHALLGVGLFAATFVASLVAVTAVLVLLPATYFREEYVSRSAPRHPLSAGLA